ncbi:MAG: hypothetical protein KUG72_11290 [Pseudomonadales bacterium]|nr:hypothetical protein [Pseudomonadales bacterium]
MKNVSLLFCLILCVGCTTFPYVQINSESIEVSADISVFFLERGFDAKPCSIEELHARFRLKQYASVELKDGFYKTFASSVFPQSGFIRACSAIADRKLFVFLYTGGKEGELNNVLASLEERLSSILQPGGYVRGKYLDARL